MDQHKPSVFYFSFVAVLAALVLAAAVTPRFLAIGPGLAGLIYSGIYVGGKKGKYSIPAPALLLTLPVLFLAGLSSLWAIDAGEALERTGKLAGIIIPGLFLIGFALKARAEDLKPLLWLLPLAIALAAIAIGLEVLLGDQIHRLIRGMGSDDPVPVAVHNRGAVIITLCAFPLAGLLYYAGRIKSLIVLVGAVVFMLATIDSQSAQQAAIVGALFALFFPFRCRYSWYALAAVISLLVLAAPFLAIWAFPYAEDVLEISFFRNGFAGARMEIWDFVSRYALENPLYGFGIEASRVIEGFDTAKIYHAGDTILHPHNFSIQLWLEFGVIGALAGSAFIAYLLHLTRTQLAPTQARVVLPAIIASLSVAATGYGLWQSWWVGLMFLVSALVILSSKLALDTEVNEANL